LIQRPFDHSSRLRTGELADEETAERLEAEQPEATLRRREFLGRTAALAGATGLASTLPVDALVASAARNQARRRPLPSPRNLPLDTFVVLMMENRSFDHYFGWHPDADAKNEGLSYPDAEGKRISTHRLTPDFQGCGHPDPDHGWTGGRWQWNRGKNNRFVTGNEDLTSSDEFAIGYYLKEDLGFIPHAAEAYTLYDRWFCSIMASTYPNRHYQLGAQNGGQKSNEFPPEVAGQTTGFTWETIFDRAQANGVTFGYYVSDLPFPGLYGQRGLATVRPIERFYSDAAAGTLPQITFVDPPFRDGGGGDGMSADEHPHGDVRLGQAFMSDVAHAFIASPQYRRGVMFINYDEWGGFFDHVPPPFVPDDRRSKDINEDWGFTGFRIPGVAISPYTRGAGVSHMTVTHESILKLISYRFGFGHLTKRHRYASNIGRSFNFRRPDFEPPELPDPERVASSPCAVGGDSQFPFPTQVRRPKEHDLVKLETSGFLERLGYEVRPATTERLFRQPDGVRRATRASQR
jgi:phospholipase C